MTLKTRYILHISFWRSLPSWNILGLTNAPIPVLRRLTNLPLKHFMWLQTSLKPGGYGCLVADYLERLRQLSLSLSSLLSLDDCLSLDPGVASAGCSLGRLLLNPCTCLVNHLLSSLSFSNWLCIRANLLLCGSN